jgi:hypothetical protein
VVGARGGSARVASSIQPLALLFKSWIWAKPPSRPITRNGRPAGNPYRVGAEADGLARTSTGCLATKTMPESGNSGSLTVSPIRSACSFGAVIACCGGIDDRGTVPVSSPAGVVVAGAGDGVGAAGVFCSTSGWGIDLVACTAGMATGGGDGVTATGPFCSTCDTRPKRRSTPATRHTPTTPKNATCFGENLLRFDRAFRAASRSILDHGTYKSFELRAVARVTRTSACGT